MDAKPTLMQLRRRYNEQTGKQITSRQIAERAGVPLADEFMMELGCTVGVDVANRVIKSFSMLTGQRYSLADIEVSLKEANRVGQQRSDDQGSMRAKSGMVRR